MWLFTTLGFFSVVQKPGDEHLTTRARVAADLDRLRADHLPALAPTVHGAGTDYPHRATIDRAAFAHALVGLAHALHYANFKDAVAATLGHERAQVYGRVWQELLALEHAPGVPGTTDAPAPPHPPAYGGVVIDDAGRVLLHAPRAHFGGYHWTFPKGRPEPGEEPVATALREVREETGVAATVRAALPGAFAGTTTATRYYLLAPTGAIGAFGDETSAIRWATRDEAARLIGRTTTPVGRARDLRVLAAAYALHERLDPATVTTHAAQYHVERRGEARVAAWSVARLPFEPTGWRKDFRQSLREQVRRLRAAPGEVLHAAYRAAENDPVDAENVLLYNVGTGHFASSTRDGLRFERALSAPLPCPLPVDDTADHHHEYRVVPRATPFRHWVPFGTLVRWEAALPRVAALRACAPVWWALKNTAPTVRAGATVPQRFGVRIAVSLPAGATVTAATLVKPLVDGVVAAAHRHDGTDEDELAARLASQLGVEAMGVLAQLRSGSGAVLGERRVLHRFGTTVQWRPRDEDCVACELLLTRDAPGLACRVVAEIVAVTASGEGS